VPVSAGPARWLALSAAISVRPSWTRSSSQAAVGWVISLALVRVAINSLMTSAWASIALIRCSSADRSVMAPPGMVELASQARTDYCPGPGAAGRRSGWTRSLSEMGTRSQRIVIGVVLIAFVIAVVVLFRGGGGSGGLTPSPHPLSAPTNAAAYQPEV